MKRWNPWIYVKSYKFNSLFFQNFILILIIILLPVLILCGIIFFYFQWTYNKDLNLSNQNALIRVQESIDMVQSNIKIIGANLTSDTSVNSFIIADYKKGFTYETAMDIKEVIKKINLILNDYIENIYIYSMLNGYLINSDSCIEKDKFFDMNWLNTMQQNIYKRSIYTWSRCRAGTTNTAVDEKKSYPCITTGLSIPLINKRQSKGYIIINIDNAWIDKLAYRNIGAYNNFYIINEEYEIIYNHESNKIGTNFLAEYKHITKKDLTDSKKGVHINVDGTDYLVNSSYSNSQKWSYVYITDLAEHNKKIQGLLSIILIAMSLLTLAVIFVAYAISIKVFLPVSSIINMIEDPKEFYEMNSVKNSPRGNYNELKYITASFLSSITEQEKTRLELMDYVTKLKNAQVSLLQAQINPHFLFNTFQVINFMAIGLTKSDNEVSNGIGMLSEMLRNMMEVDRNLIPIREEIAYSKSYIGLEQLRYQDEFSVLWDIEENILDNLTLKISLQPLLENCIRHGFRKKRQGERIIITGKRIDEQILFTVWDNGEGKDEEWIIQMNEELQEFQSIVGNHIGIRNVNQRLIILFGKEYGLQIKDVESGFMICMVIPTIKD